jgi:hypothetical protein
MFFDLTKTGVSVKEDALLVPEVRELYDTDKTKGKESFHKAIDYVYHVYDKRSVYANVLLEDRKKIVSSDRIQKPDYHVKAEDSDKIRALIEKLKVVQFTPKEQLLEGARDKIEEYLKFWRETKIKADNHKLVKELTENSETLLKLVERLEKKVLDERSQRTIGGGESTLFED